MTVTCEEGGRGVEGWGEVGGLKKKKSLMNLRRA